MTTLGKISKINKRIKSVSLLSNTSIAYIFKIQVSFLYVSLKIDNSVCVYIQNFVSFSYEKNGMGLSL